jgi:YegS/Rv2252/BmrU family lipid kinase
MSQNFRSLVIANPHSANGSLGRKWDSIVPLLEDSLGKVDHRFTKAPRDATKLCREALDGGAEMVVAVGGDGTISEVVNGFFSADGSPVNDRAVLGILPFGTGGDLRKTLGIPKKLSKSTKMLAGRQTRRIDVGKMSYTDPDGNTQQQFFANIASFGISGLVDQMVNRGGKALGGRLAFAFGTIRAMRKYRTQVARFSVDGGEEFELPIVMSAIANGQFFGGGMRIAPEASIDDGLFDIVSLGPMNMADLLLRGGRVYKGTHLDFPEVTFLRGKKIRAEPVDENEAILLDVDGETPGMLPATFEIMPAALRLKVA